MMICLMMAVPAFANAQNDVYSIKNAISRELDKEEKVYTSSGSYNRIFYYKFMDDNLLQVRQFSNIIRSGERETNNVISITIDMNKVTGIFSNVTNFGYKCIEIEGLEYVLNTQYIYEGDNEWGDIIYTRNIALASDNDELIRLLKEWAELVKK